MIDGTRPPRRSTRAAPNGWFRRPCARLFLASVAEVRRRCRYRRDECPSLDVGLRLDEVVVTVSDVTGAEMSGEDLVADWQSVRAGVTRTQRRIDHIMEHSGLPARWFAVLNLLLRAEDHRLPMSVLARDMSMTTGGFTKLADRMAREGLIDRRGSLDDRRVVHARLTGDGLQMARQVTRVYQSALRECLLSIVTADELRSAATTMRALSIGHAATVEPDAAPGRVATQRGPARPDRRGRGSGQLDG